MSFWTNPGKVISHFFHGKNNTYDDSADSVRDQIADIGEDAFYAALNVGLASLNATSGGTIGAITAVATLATDILKQKGHVNVSATVTAAAAAAVAKLHAEGK